MLHHPVSEPSTRRVSTPGRTDQLGNVDPYLSATDSRPRIVAALPAELARRFERSVLGRRDLDPRCVADPEVAMQIVHVKPPSLLLLYDSGFGALTPLLARLKRAFPKAPFAVIVLAELPGERYPDLVVATLPVDVDPTELSIAIAKALRPATSGYRRHLIRVGVRLDDPSSMSVAANTVDVSCSGMTFECTRRLHEGATYQVSFLGQSQTPILNLRVVRQAHSRHPNLLRYAGTFENADLHVVDSLVRQVAG